MRSSVSLQQYAASPACSEQKQLALCRPRGRCSRCTAFLAAFFGDVEVGSRVPSGCCTRLKTDIPPQTCRLQGPASLGRNVGLQTSATFTWDSAVDFNVAKKCSQKS